MMNNTFKGNPFGVYNADGKLPMDYAFVGDPIQL